MNKKLIWKLSLLDILFCVLLGLICLALFLNARQNLAYHWHWELMPQYLIYFDQTTKSWHLNSLLLGFFTTIRLGFWSILLALFLGSVIALCRISSSLYLRLLARTYIGCIRNTPPIIVIFIFYFFLGDHILPNVDFSFLTPNSASWQTKILSTLYCPPEQLTGFTAAIFALAVLEAAYLAEIIRGGIENISRGQWEAALASGFSRWQALRLVIFPQALPLILPPLAGQCISTIKDSAIVSVISIQELTFQGEELSASTYLTFETWITVTLLYFILTFTCSRLVAKLESNHRDFSPNRPE